jgi:acetoin utilization deacetylase AcuC-like enzyme/lysophospholipase L1-like esterase
MAKHRPLPETAYDSAWDRGVLTTQSPPGALIQFGGAVGTNERPERILATIQALEEGGILDLCVAVPCREARDDEIRLVHTAEHVDGLARLSAQSSSTSSESSGGGSAATGGSTAGSGETKEGTTGETVATRRGVQQKDASCHEDTDKQPTRILAYGDSLTAGYWRNGMGEWAPYVDAIGERFPTVSCSHVGMSGWGTVQMVEAMQEEEVQCCCGRSWAGLLVALKRTKGKDVEQQDERGSVTPPLVLIMAGTNDLGDTNETSSTDAIVDNLAQLHAAVHAAGSRTVALSIPEHGQEGELAFIREKRLAVNQRLEELALANPQWMHFVDAAAIVPFDDGTISGTSGTGCGGGAGGAPNSELWDDLLHMTPAGYTALGRGVAQRLQEAGVLEAEEKESGRGGERDRDRRDALLRHQSQYNYVYMGDDSVEAARLAVGATIDATLAVVRGDLASSAAVVRPPGHHSEPGCPMGFCLYNNVGVAAAVAMEQYPELCKRVLIVDWDIHHGNGTFVVESREGERGGER